jgi:ketosteroid isomerase-like protein
MQQRYIFAVIAASLAIVGNLQVPASASVQSTKRAIQAAYNKISEGYRRRDANAILSNYMSDYKLFNPDGTLDLPDKAAKQARVLKILSHVHDKVVDRTTVQSVVASGNGAVVTVHEDYHRYETDPRHHLFGDFHQQSVSRSYWVKTPSGWKNQQERCMGMATTITVNGVVTKRGIDGEPVQ